MKKVGIIGIGHMGDALLEGLLKSGIVESKNVFISDGDVHKARNVARETGCHLCQDNAELATQCDVVILAVTPAVLPQVLKEIALCIKDDVLVISLVASFSIAKAQEVLGSHVALARAIPNIPVSVCQGMTSIAIGEDFDEQHREWLMGLFESVGKVAFVDEKKLDVAIAVSGCSPAFVALFIEAMADAAVYAGLSRDEAYLISEQAVLGTAATLLKKRLLPAEFKDRVATPGGITIKGIAALEEHGFRNAVFQAIRVSAGK